MTIMEQQQQQVQARRKAEGAKRDRSANLMRGVVVDKLVINIGSGSEENIHANARRLLELITGRKPADALSKKRNPSFKISKGQKIGAFVTIRGEAVPPLAKRLFAALDDKIRESCITDNSVSFGIKEYIDISGIKYDPKIGMLGMNVNLSIKRKGDRVRLRKRRNSGVPDRHRVVGREEITAFLEKEYNVKVLNEA